MVILGTLLVLEKIALKKKCQEKKDRQLRENLKGTPPSPSAVGPRAWRGALGGPRQENQKTYIRKRKGQEIKKERKKEKKEMHFHCIYCGISMRGVSP